MTQQAGTPDNPLRVAIVGSGPSGFYAAERLQKNADLTVEIDMYERLPTPYGLVRGGVAPDHPKIKSVTKVYDRIAEKDDFRFYGNVEFGKDISMGDMGNFYHAVIFAVGAQTDRRMGIPGEELIGSYAATEFVGWYNAHPDFRDFQFDSKAERIAVIGNGNVAMDVARILGSSRDELAQTDIADYALDALASSRIKEIYVLGRRGPAQAAFTNPEIKELGELAEADVLVRPEDATLDELTQQWLEENGDKTAQKNVAILQGYAQNQSSGKPKTIHMRFLESPVEIIGEGKVEAIKIVKNELYQKEDGSLRPRPTEQFETLAVDQVFRSIGYHGVPLPGLPFYDRWGVIPNNAGRVTTEMNGDETVTGAYVVGWIKRGPSGIIGTNKPDSYETVDHLLEDVAAGNIFNPSQPTREAVEALLGKRKPEFVTFEDWQLLDAVEQEMGQQQNRPRIKFSRVDAMLTAIKARKSQVPGN